jgi:polyphosphate kinase 2 (PPK2 family)
MKTAIKLRRDKISVAALDTDSRIGKAAYEKKLAALQQRMQTILQAYLHTGDRAVVVFEGVDAAGKGGTIRRLTSVLDPRAYKVWPIGAPNEVERKQHYLTRFWGRLPESGRLAVFDRSWYGRVLVERVERFATKAEWGRAYAEINEFEHMLINDGVRLVKIFLHVPPDEQLARFKQRVSDPLKRWKLTFEDVRNREKWDFYEMAIDEMIAKTSTVNAPWHVIATNHKKRARIEALSLITEQMAAGVDLKPRPLDPELQAAAEETLGLNFD